MAKDYVRILTDLRSRVENVSKENARIEGQLSAVIKKMEKEYGFSTVKDAKEYITKLNGEITKMKTEVESQVYEIKEILDGFEE